MNKKDLQGFTLLKIILVAAAMAILAGIVILTVNPNAQLSDTKNAQRRVDINIILNAVYKYSVDNNGAIPAGVTSSSTEICKDGGTCTGLVNLGVLITNEKYLTSMPVDPAGAISTNGTGYYISKSTNGRITVSAPQAEQEVTINVTR